MVTTMTKSYRGDTSGGVMSDLGDALRAARESRGLTLYKANQLTGVPRTNLEGMESGERGLTFKTLHDLAGGYALTKEEAANLFMILVRDKMLEEMEEMAIWLFLSVADDDAMTRIADVLRQRGISADPQFVQSVLLTIAERESQGEQRRMVAPLILQSLTVSLAEQSVWIVPGPATEDVLSSELALVASDSASGDSPRG